MSWGAVEGHDELMGIEFIEKRTCSKKISKRLTFFQVLFRRKTEKISQWNLQVMTVI